MGAEVGCVGKVDVEGWRAHALLDPGQPRRLPADYGYEAIAQAIAPCGQPSSICSALSLRLSQVHTASTHSGRGVGFPHQAASPFAREPGLQRGGGRVPRSRGHHAGDTWEQSAGECLGADRAVMASGRGGCAAWAAVRGRARAAHWRRPASRASASAVARGE